MKAIAAILILAASVGTVLAQDVDCATDDTQMALNICSARQLERDDAELNRVWPLARNAMRAVDAFNEGRFDTQAEANLLKAQRAWITYRDGHCHAVGAQYAGGSIRPLVINSCLSELTVTRTKELLLLLEEG